MKNVAVLLMALLPAVVFAQLDIKISESTQTFSKGAKPAYQFEIPQAHLKQTKSDWMDYLKKSAKGKPAIVNGEVWMNGAVNDNVTFGPFAVYSTLLETTTGVTLTAWVSFNNDSIYISPSISDRNLAVKKYLHDFALLEYKVVVKAQLQAENVKLKKLQNELESLYKQQDKANKKGNEFSRDIERNRDKIRTNENDQQTKQSQIATQKQVVDDQRNNPGPELDAARKSLKEYQSALNKLINQKEKLHRQIDKWEANIRAQDRNTTAALNNQKTKSAEIDQQKAAVKVVSDRLDNIR